MSSSQVGRYQILRKLATGGMAEIFLARQEGMEGVERTVVIKRILQHRARDAEFVTMFLDEARIVATLVHPNIAQIYELGKEDDCFFLVMEYVRGPDLGKLLDTIYESGGRGLPLRIALPILIGVCEALHYIHEKRDEHGTPLGIVHRDINPQNVVVSYEGAVKLIDFGIAKAKTKVYETRTGVIKGTYGYMAPEQLTRKAPIDRRSDVFALGVLLYEAVLGVHPFEASDEVSLLGHIVRGDFRRPRAVRADFPEELERVVLGCLAPRPEQRIPDARTVQLHLEEFMAANHLVVSMARLGDFVRDVVPEPVPTESARAPSAGRRIVVDGPTPPNLQFPVPEDSVVAALAGESRPQPRAEDDDDFGVPVFPSYEEDSTGFVDSPEPASGAGATAQGYALTPSPAPLPMAPLPGAVLAAPLVVDGLTQSTTQRTEESSVSVLTVLGKKQRGSSSGSIDVPPPSNLGRLGPTMETRIPRFWRSPTARGIALVALAAAGGALLAALGVAVVTNDGQSAAVAQPAPAEPLAPVAPPQGSVLAKSPPPPLPVFPSISIAPAALPLVVDPPLPPPPAPALPERKTLLIQSTPPGATIWIDGALQEAVTPATIELPEDVADFVTVRVHKTNYQAMEREVEVITGTSVFELQRAISRRRHRARRPHGR
ncbi:MAG: serine/threonine protein kinase [Deltaproteobacteria bacterium]|nr:serine/threonine protein kinase [Deltaproteobacteria bacterium]